MGERGDDTAKKPKKDKKDKKEKKEKKEKRERDDADDATACKKTKKPEPVPAAEEGLEELEEEEEGLVFKSAEDGGKVKTKAGGAAPPALGAFPTSSTSVYMGNLAWSIDEDAIKQAFEDCGEVLSINWFEEKETKKFMGAGVVEFESAEAARRAVAAAGRSVHNRETKIRHWEQRGNTGEEKKAAKSAKFDVKPLGPKPPGCFTLFMGNLNFGIDDDTMRAFFKDEGGAEMVTVRWLTHKESGEFRGVGFADFADDENLDKAAELNGKPCMGRPIRMDWQAPKNKY